MDVVGSEIGQKMRSAIKAKLTELGCYVDDELPDYVMVMVANKRTRAQMDEDLQLFLGDNTELFVNWLHQVLKKLQEVQVTAPLRVDTEKVKERSKSKDRKPKEKKEKDKIKKSDAGKKTKKKEKEKTHKKKEDKKVHKEKRRNKHNESIRPNIPPMLMNMEKHSEPSITDVFAGQILKNHGITLDHKHDITQIDAILLKEKKPILPLIDPASIPSQSEPSPDEADKNAAREEQIKEVHDIEAKISGLKKKLADQLDTMSEDEDFLNIRTEAEELLNDFAEDVFQEISQTAPVTTPPLDSRKSPISHTSAPLIQTPKVLPKDLPKDVPKNISKELSKDLLKKTPKEPVDILPHIELNLPKRPIRERLGVRGTTKESAENKEKDKNKAKLPTSPERLTPERQPEMKPEQTAKKYSGGTPERPWRSSVSDESSIEKPEQNKRPISKVSVLEARGARASCASVVRVRPRPRVCAPANNLLMKAVADAHKSLLNAPPKIEPQQRKLQRALVLPMRRCIDNQKIVIQVPRDVQTDTNTNIITDLENNGENKNKSSNNIVNKKDKEIISPLHITKVIKNTDYVPDRAASKREDTLIIETKNKQKSNSKKHKNTQFIVTMDGFQPNTFLAKKLMMEGLLDENDELAKTALPKPTKSVLITKETEEAKEKENNETVQEYENKEDEIMQQKSPAATENLTRKLSDSSEISKIEPSDVEIKALSDISDKCDNQKKRLSDASEESYTQVIIKTEPQETGEKRKCVDGSVSDNSEKMLTPPIKKRKASPIVFNIDNKEKETERVRERTQSASSDSHVTITTSANSHKFDSVPPLSVAERKLVWCRAFPLCRYGSACAFAHPRCKFAAGCTRRACVYAHCPPASPPAVASHVVPAANYKSISSAGAISICKFYPSCVNPGCHFYHPKPCRYGKACGNKLECNFYHNDAPAAKWKYA